MDFKLFRELGLDRNTKLIYKSYNIQTVITQIR